MKAQQTLAMTAIQPIGNFDELLTSLRTKTDIAIANCQTNNKYNKSLSTLIKFICGELAIPACLENGIQNPSECWNVAEAKICLLYTYLMIIDLNATAHFYLNGFTLPDRMELLQGYIDDRPAMFGKLTLTA